LRGTVIQFAVDCHPWNGHICLAILTADEAAADESLLGPEEMAAWRHYRFSDGADSWRPVADLGREMRAAYEAADDRAAAAESYLLACARAVAASEVGAAITRLECDPRFRISVPHPDDGREFYTPTE
jgi:hypothetical protein